MPEPASEEKPASSGRGLRPREPHERERRRERGRWRAPAPSSSAGDGGCAAALTFSFFLSSAFPAGPGVMGPPKDPPPASPLRWAALTLGGVMAAAAEVRGMRGRLPGVGGWWPCWGETAGWGRMVAAGKREGELGVRRGDTVAVGRSGAGTGGWAVEGGQRTVKLPARCRTRPFGGRPPSGPDGELSF